MAEIVNDVLIWVSTILGSITLSGVVVAIIYGCLRGGFTKAINRVDVKKIAEKTVDEAVAKIKDLSFKQSIEPIATSELEKINEKSNEYILKALKDTQDNYNKLLNVFEKFASYFDNSISVTDAKREELSKALAEAKSQTIENFEQDIKIEDNVIEVEEIETEIKR